MSLSEQNVDLCKKYVHVKGFCLHTGCWKNVTHLKFNVYKCFTLGEMDCGPIPGWIFSAVDWVHFVTVNPAACLSSAVFDCHKEHCSLTRVEGGCWIALLANVNQKRCM
uniref:Uncharacterized protein n=1 Tax=Pyxicephalus adspersus TaxID=30357 RepID=A0AAV2ZXE6_PYXAD|nr:TPA: hypothetical protein GDO54_014169 [Pyxicephalus adspersus]